MAPELLAGVFNGAKTIGIGGPCRMIEGEDIKKGSISGSYWKSLVHISRGVVIRKVIFDIAE